MCGVIHVVNILCAINLHFLHLSLVRKSKIGCDRGGGGGVREKKIESKDDVNEMYTK